MDKVGIIVLHYLNSELTLDCLSSLSSCDKEKIEFEIYLVLNSSDKTLSQKIKDDYQNVILVENNQNTGFSRANNLGIRKAIDNGCNHFLLLNNDTVVHKKLILGLVHFVHNNKEIGLVSPKIYFAPDHEYHHDRYKKKDRGKVIWYAGGKLDMNNVYAGHLGLNEVDHGQFNKTSETDFATGCCMLITKEMVDKVGLLEEKYFMYFEDIDYSFRAKKANLKVMYYPEVFLWHKNASTSGSPGSSIHIYYQTRNRLYFGFKYFPLRVKKSLLIDSLRLGFRGGAYFRGVRDYYLGKMGRM